MLHVYYFNTSAKALDLNDDIFASSRANYEDEIPKHLVPCLVI